MTDAVPDASAQQTSEPIWSALDLALRIAQLAYDLRAEQAVILHVTDALQVTDYFVICEGRNKRHVNAVAQHVAAELKQTGLHRIGGSDLHDERWVLLDFGPVVLHVFAPDARDFYDLENLWGDCERVAWTPVDPGAPSEE